MTFFIKRMDLLQFVPGESKRGLPVTDSPVGEVDGELASYNNGILTPSGLSKSKFLKACHRSH